MAQGSYPAYLQQQQPYASYPSAGSQSPAPPSQSPYDPQTNYQARYQHPAYSQPLSTLNTGQTYPYPVPPQLQSVQGQSLTHASSPYTISPQSPVPLHVPPSPHPQSQYTQYNRPSPSPHPYSVSSVVNPYPSPTSPQNPQSPTRRPLPDPHRHLDSLSSHPHSLPTPQPSPSPGPFPPSQQVLHRPSNSVPSSAFARSNVTVPAGSSRDAPGTPLSPLSATSTSPPRPLPLPRSLGSFDLAGSHSESEIRSQSPTRRALPGTELPPVQRGTQGAHDQSAAQPLPAPGQKFVPLWKRSLPQPSSSSVSPQPQGAIERRGTVSGASARPLPQSPVATAGTSAPAVSRAPANGASLPPHLQMHRLPPTPQSAVAPRSAFAPTATASYLSKDLRLGLRERSRTLPTPATSPSSPPSLQTSSPPKPRPASPAKRLVESPASSDDEDLTNALLARPVRSPSPKYGILDMPSRSRTAQPTAVPRTEIAPRSPRTLPIQQSAPQTQASDSSVAFRLAALSLRSASPSRPSHGHSQSVGAPSATRWPANLPPLPRAPTSPSPSSPASPHPRPLPSRNQSAFSSPGIRSPRKVDLDLSLDDAPPPSLRRSPAPSSPAPRESTRTPTSRSALPTIRTLTNSTPAVAPPNVPAFSLSSFPAPRSRQQSPRIPKISFPANVDENSDDEDDGGPVISVSGPGDSNAGMPSINVNGMDEGSGMPSINVGFADGPSIPQISIPGDSVSGRSPQQDAPQMVSVTRSGLYCGGCGGAIIGRIVSAMGARWHPGCFRCCICNELLENLSSYEHNGRPYCHLDYHERYAPKCYHCETAIVDERFITLDDPELGKRTYHEQHFFCAECGDPFLPPALPGAANRTFEGDGAFAAGDDDVGFTVYRGHPYCEACHVRLRMPKCKKCKKSIRDGMQAVEALGGKWCWECFTCASCEKPFEDPAFFQRDGKPFCERCFSIMIKSEM